jgi:nucleotidyltransferase/DNA polymerase involved in DNA repair
MRTILHVDLDAFYPSVEVREHPELEGRPVIVGADPKEGRGRGVGSSASYEAYLDLSGRVEDLDQAANLARTIMQEVLDREDLSCSVGVAPNKMLAKIGSDFRKPYGLTVISEKGAKEFLSPLGVRT